MTMNPEVAHALDILEGRVPLYAALAEAAELRERHFGKAVRIHILDNIQNGRCAEDCGYCAQRKDANSGIEPYSLKSNEAIYAEAEAAKASGAYRFCMVTAGTGPSARRTDELAELIRRITDELGLRVCLSAGLIDQKKAEVLSAAGLDRYNHNLNTAEEHYGEICTTHTYRDRVRTLENLSSAGVGLCSGVIVGLGEKAQHLVDAAHELARLRVASIPVNFFIPVPGHAVENVQALTPEYCLRVLIVFRLLNPASEVRIAAGREGHLRSLQAPALMVANSLFASGYLNVQGSNLAETLQLIHDAGYFAETAAGEPFAPANSAVPGYSEERVKELLKFPQVSS
jgi:biotin synthase